MMKKKLFKTSIILFTSLIALFALSCNIGLGDAVDTANPTVEISYPPKNAVIRDSFVAAGKCDDDLAMDYVDVTLTNASSKEKYGPYKATLNDDKNAWTVTLNQKTEGDYSAFESYKQWEFPDGDYILTAVSYDKNKNASQESSIPINIDNTAPVLLVSKPLAFGTEKPSIYGRTLNIIGDISEEHETKKLTLYYREYNDSTHTFIDAEPRTLEISGFGTMSSDNPLTIAKVDQSVQNAASAVLTQNYNTIYGEVVDISSAASLAAYTKKIYYCGFLLEDSAKVYKDPKDSGVEEGNKTTQYYILSDDFNKNLFSEDTKSLNARNLMLLLRGQSSYSEAEIPGIISSLNTTGNSASSQNIDAALSSKFSIDPKSNPVWSITNFEYDETEQDFTTYEPGSAVPLVLKSGGDGIALNKNSITIELYHLGVTPAPITATTPHLTLVSNSSEPDVELKTMLNQSDSQLQFSDGTAGLKINHYYEFKMVSGEDTSGNPIESEDGKRFGFKRYSSFAAPRVSFESPASGGYYKENEYYSGSDVDLPRNEGGIKIKGKIVTAAKQTSDDGGNLINEIEIGTDEDLTNQTTDKICVSKITVIDTTTSEERVIPASDYSCEISGFSRTYAGLASEGYVYNFTAEITKADGKTLNPEKPGSYKVKVAFIAEDSLTVKSDPTEFEFKLDNKKPEITASEIVVSPTVTEAGLDYVNGEVKIFGTVSDSGSGLATTSPLYYYQTGSTTPTPITLSGVAWNFDFDTTVLTDNSEYTLNIYAKDKVGNVLELPYLLHIKQETDRPKVTFTNTGDNVIFTNPAVIIGNVTDDDGLSQVQVFYRKLRPGTPGAESPVSFGTLTSGSTSCPLAITLPDGEGEYKIIVKAEDNKGLATGKLGFGDSEDSAYKAAETIEIKKDNGAPVLEITSPTSSAQTYYKDNFSVEGTVKDGSGVATITRKVYKNGTEIPAASLPAGFGTLAVTGSVVTGADWSDTVPVTSLGNGSYKIEYYAADKYASNAGQAANHTSMQTLEFSIDVTPPAIDADSVKMDGNSISAGWYNKNNGLFSVKASDSLSSVVSLVYSLNYSASAVPSSVSWNNMEPDSTNTADQTSWKANITFEGSGTEKHLALKAIDSAGNESTIVEKTLRIDTIAPSLTVKDSEGNNLAETIYINNTAEGFNGFEISGIYNDGSGESGIATDENGHIRPLQFTIGNHYFDVESTTETLDLKPLSSFEYDSTNHTYSAVISKEDFGSDGGKLSVIGTDNAGNKKVTASTTFIVDTEAPKIEDIEISAPSAYKKTVTGQTAEYYIRKSDGAFTISGTATDDGGLFENIKLTITGQGETTIGPFTSTNSSWTFNDSTIDLSSWNSPATVTLEATDRAKNKKTVSFTIKFDQDAPQIITGEGPDNRYNFRGEDIVKYNNLKLGEGRYCEYSYGRLNSVDFEIFVNEEGSGLSKLEYKLFTAGSVSSTPDFTTSGAAQTGTFLLKEGEYYSFYDSNVGSIAEGTAWKATASIPGFAPTTGSNTNYLVIRPTDNCGNTGAVTVLSVHVDQTAPVINATHTEQLTNGTKKIELSGSAYDVDSGIKALRVLVNGVAKMELNADSLSGTVTHTDGSQTSADGVVTNVTGGYGTFSYKGYAPDKESPVAQSPANPTITAATPSCTLTNASSYVEWNLILDPEGDWFADAGERPVISIEVEDWAEHDGLGNKNPTATKIATLRVDTEAPAVTISSPAVNTNNPTRLNGMNTISGTSSDEGSSPAKVDLYYSTDASAPAALSGYTRLKTLTTASAPANPDALTTYNRNISQLYNYSFDVDFYDFVTTNEITKPVWILVVATDEAGNTSIDNGISPVEYIVDRNTDRPVISISEYSLKPKNNIMSADNRVLLKEKQLFIDVTDDDGLAASDYAFFRTGRLNATTGATDYTNWTAITLNSGNGSFELDSDGKQIIEFKIIDANGTEFTSTAGDWKKVYVEDLKGNKYGLETEGSSYAAPVIYTILDTELPVVAIEGVSTDDGATWTAPDSFTTVLGGDTEEIKLKIHATDNGSGIKTNADGSPSADAVTLTKKIGSGAGQPVTVTPSTVAGEAGIYYATIDCTIGDGLMNITVTAQDNASRTGTATKQFRIDNTDPEITVSTPASGSEQSDQIFAVGTFTESVNFWYAVSPVETSPDATTSWTYIKKNPESGEVTSGNTFPVTNKAGETIPLASLATVCAYREYSNSAVSTFNIQFDGATNSTPDHTYDLNGWLKAMGITIQEDLVSTTNPFEDLITLYLHLKAVDSAGNKKEVAWPILVNPQGSRPTVEFSYPAADEENPILGGKINLMGSAKGKHTITEVYMQIDCNNDGSWTTADETILASDDYGYTLENIPGLYYPGTTTLQKGIKINVNGSVWSQKINENREFNPAETGTPRQIKVRVYARDTSAVPPLLSSAKIKSFRVDNDLPQIDQDIKLVQWNTGFDASTGLVVEASGDNAGSISFAEGSVKAQRSYTDRMYVSGKWYVIGKVTDDSGISQVALGETEDTATAIGNSLGSDGSIKKAFVTGGKTNYVFCFPVGSDTTNAVDVSEVTLRATDNGSGSNAKTQTKQFIVNYDNKAPDVTPIAANKKIFNTNGLYTIESEAYENTVNNKNQSGIERIVFYFTRNVTSQATKIFDPMLKVNTSGNIMDYSGLPYEDDLYWQSAEVTEVNQTSITVSSLPSCAHKYGLAKVNGVIYRIESIEGTSVTLSGAPGETSSALFAIANVIDNTNPENIPGEYNTLTTDYGYGYPTGIYDDGDLMPEHLTKVGTKYNWDATINSRNISDGSVTLHYIAFDKAGNRAALDVAAMVQNNAPRIAGATIGIDEDGNGKVDEDEFYNNDLYSNCYEDGMDGAKKAIDVTIPKTSTAASPVSAIKIRRTLVIKPEIVGGNGALTYTYSVAKRKTTNDGWNDPYYSYTTPGSIGTGTAETETVLNGEIKLPLKQLLAKDDDDNNITDGANQKFAFTIHDSTPGENQKAVMNVIMDVELNDTAPALNKIIPFYWKDAENNSLAENSREKGHIELSKDLPSSFTAGGTGIYGLNPKISGAIKLEGIAQDNSLLKNLSVKLTNSEGSVLLNQVIAEYNGSWPEETTGSGWSTKITQATYGELLAAGYITALPSGKTADQKVPYASQEYGHVVHWTWTLDTEEAGIAVQAGLVITVGALDYGKPSLNGNGAAVYVNNNAFANNGVTGTVAQTGGDNGQAAHTCKYSVDVVPYIRGFKTALSKKSKKEDTSEYDRTALGHYPVARTERIGVYGFNLAGATLYDSPVDAAGNALTSHTAVLGTTKTKDIDGDGKNDTSIFVYATAADALTDFTSSAVYVKVGNIESLNNKNDNDAQGSYGVAAADIPERDDYGKEDTYETFSNFYNRMPNETSNYGLTDDTYLDIWYFDSRAAKPSKPGVISDPIMKINPSSDLIGFAYQSGPRVFSMAKKDNSYQEWLGDFDNLSATGFTYDSEGNTFGTALGGDINGASSVAKFAFMTSLWGQSGTGNDRNKSGDRHQRFEQIGQIGTKADKSPAGANNQTDAEGNYIDKSRVLSPSLAVSGSGANAKVYLAYYDHMNQEIRFRWASQPKSYNDKRGWNGIGYISDAYGSKNLGDNGEKVNLHGETVKMDKYNVYQFAIIAESAAYTYDAQGKGSPTTTTALGNPGSYVAIDVIPDGGTNADNTKYDVVVMVWYDEEDGNLMYTYNKKDLSTLGADFEGSAKTKDNWYGPEQIFTGAGQYCQIKVAGDNSIHIAAYDKDAGDIRYAKLGSYVIDGDHPYSEDTMSCVVDSNGIVGTNLTIDVAMNGTGNNAKAIPYISYYGSFGPKMAYLTEEGAALTSLAKGTAKEDGDCFTGYWEVSNVPTPSNAPKDRVNVAVWKDSAGVIKNSVHTADTSHEGSGTTSANGTTYGNGTAYPVVAYEIRPTSAEGYMETAQKQ